MIVIPERRLVLLLPWKCASQTLRSRLGALDARPYPTFFHVNSALGRLAHQHLTLADFEMLPEARRGYRIAVFVRNPYDRVHSGFLQLRRDVVWQRHAAFPDEAVKSAVLRQLDGVAAALGAARGSASRWFSSLADEVVLTGGFNSSIPLHPCHYWTHRDGRQAVDFIGRVETFEADFHRLRETYDLPDLPLDSTNVSKVPDAAPPDGAYRHARKFDAAARARIERLFADDFAQFGYATADLDVAP